MNGDAVAGGYEQSCCVDEINAAAIETAAAVVVAVAVVVVIDAFV